MNRNIRFLFINIDFRDFYKIEDSEYWDFWLCWDKDCNCWELENAIKEDKNLKYKKVSLYDKTRIYTNYTSYKVFIFTMWLILWLII